MKSILTLLALALGSTTALAQYGGYRMPPQNYPNYNVPQPREPYGGESVNAPGYSYQRPPSSIPYNNPNIYGGAPGTNPFVRRGLNGPPCSEC